jgi:hypothetical protein
MPGYDANITKVPKATSPVQTIVPKATMPTDTKVPKPYPEEPNVLHTEAGVAILNEDGSGLLIQVG